MKHLLLSILLFPAMLFAQAPTSFETFDCNNLAYYTHINSLHITNDTLLMPTTAGALQNFAVARTMGGNLLWSVRTIPDSLQGTLGGSCILSDGNLLIIYTVTVNSTGQNLVVKMNKAGHIIWERFYAGAGANSMPAVVPTNDGGFIMSGGGCSGGFLTMRCDVSGNILWTKAFSFSSATGSTSTMRLINGGQNILFDCIFNNGTYQCIRLFETDMNAQLLWTKDYDFGSDARCSGTDEIPGGGGFVVSGQLMSGGHSEPLLFRTDASGNLTWARMAAQGAESMHDNVLVLPDNSLLAVGSRPYVYAQMMTFNCGLIDHYDAFGNLLESYRLPCDTVNFRLANSVITELQYSAQSGLVYATGQGTNLGMIITILPINAHTCGSVSLNPVSSTPAVTVTSVGGSVNLISYAMANFFYTEEVIPVTFYGDCVNITTNLSSSPVIAESISFFPNPATSDHVRVNATIAFDRFEIYDVNGKIIMKGVPAADGEITIPEEAGVYFVKIIGGENSVVEKLVKL